MHKKGMGMEISLYSTEHIVGLIIKTKVIKAALYASLNTVFSGMRQGGGTAL
jgi:hypothetical protein